MSLSLKPKQPEKFSGSRDQQTVISWITSVDSYFSLTNAAPPNVYHYLNTILAGEAAIWFRFHYRDPDPAAITWNHVKANLKAYFVQPNHERRLRDQWAYLRQTNTVTEFYSELTKLAMELNLTDEEQLLDKFVRGLKSKTKTEVELRDPRTLEEASKIADRFDTIVYRKQPPWMPQYTTTPSNSFVDDGRGTPMLIDSLRRSPRYRSPNTARIDAFKAKHQPGPLNKLSDEERTHLRNINACFKCRKPGHMARECPQKGNSPSSGNSKRQ
jgi:hypothetical protein